MLSQIRIVLVSPGGSANVGSVCRAMANMGLNDLVIVAPRCDVHADDAIAYASHGRPVLDGLRIVDDIPRALEDCTRTYVTTSRLGLYRRQAAVTPREAAPDIVSHADRARVAIAFGREDYGLKVNELLHFDRILTIPADDGYPVMNLAASAAVVCYELRQAWIEHRGDKALPMAIEHGFAGDQRKQVMFEKFFDALDRVGFLDERSPERLKYGLRHMFGRLDLTVTEVDILIGMAAQIRWYVDHHPAKRDPPTS